MRLSLSICLLCSALAWAACSSPAPEPAAVLTPVADSLLADTSASISEILKDSQPPAGNVGLRFGGNAPIGSSRKPLPGSLDGGLVKPSPFLRRSPVLGLPNRGLFPPRFGDSRPAPQAPTEAEWSAQLACESASSPVPMTIRWEDGALQLQVGQATSSLPLGENESIYFSGCGNDAAVVIQDNLGRSLPHPGVLQPEPPCTETHRQAIHGPVLCLPTSTLEVRIACGDRLVAYWAGEFYAFNLQRCGMGMALEAGSIRLYTSCADEPSHCE
jgi:hypothetical protein